MTTTCPKQEAVDPHLLCVGDICGCYKHRSFADSTGFYQRLFALLQLGLVPRNKRHGRASLQGVFGQSKPDSSRPSSDKHVLSLKFHDVAKLLQ
jgi:hypothetical protein